MAVLVPLAVPHVVVDAAVVVMVVAVVVLLLPHVQIAPMAVVEVVPGAVVADVQVDAVQVVVGNAKILRNLQHALVVATTVVLPVQENAKLLVPQPVRAVVTEEIVQENVQEVVRVAVVEHVSLHVMTPVTILSLIHI